MASNNEISNNFQKNNSKDSLETDNEDEEVSKFLKFD